MPDKFESDKTAMATKGWTTIFYNPALVGASNASAKALEQMPTLCDLPVYVDGFAIDFDDSHGQTGVYGCQLVCDPFFTEQLEDLE